MIIGPFDDRRGVFEARYVLEIRIVTVMLMLRAGKMYQNDFHERTVRVVASGNPGIYLDIF